MGKAARAIIIHSDKLLVMRRIKQGSLYFTLVGGRVDETESLDQAVVREVREETGLSVTRGRLLYYEVHPEPYNHQYIYLCEIESHQEIKLLDESEEAMLNRTQVNIHEPMWVDFKAFERLAFRTPQLQEAIIKGLKKGWPKEPVKL